MTWADVLQDCVQAVADVSSVWADYIKKRLVEVEGKFSSRGTL